MSVLKISVLNLSSLLLLFSLLLSMYHCDYLPMYVSVSTNLFFFRLNSLFISPCVSVLPTIRVWQSEVNATADVGEPAKLTCAVDGYPEPMVTWTR